VPALHAKLRARRDADAPPVAVGRTLEEPPRGDSDTIAVTLYLHGCARHRRDGQARLDRLRAQTTNRDIAKCFDLVPGLHAPPVGSSMNAGAVRTNPALGAGVLRWDGSFCPLAQKLPIRPQGKADYTAISSRLINRVRRSNTYPVLEGRAPRFYGRSLFLARVTGISTIPPQPAGRRNARLASSSRAAFWNTASFYRNAWAGARWSSLSSSMIVSSVLRRLSPGDDPAVIARVSRISDEGRKRVVPTQRRCSE